MNYRKNDRGDHMIMLFSTCMLVNFPDIFKLAAYAEQLKQPTTDHERRLYIALVNDWGKKITSEIVKCRQLPIEQQEKRRLELLIELDKHTYAQEVLYDTKLPREQIPMPFPLKRKE